MHFMIKVKYLLGGLKHENNEEYKSKKIVFKLASKIILRF